MPRNMDAYDFMLDEFFSEMIKEALKAYRAEDLANDEKHGLIDVKGARAQAIIDSLPEEDRAFVQSYDQERRALYRMETDFLYLQGHRDCLRLLSVLHCL